MAISTPYCRQQFATVAIIGGFGEPAAQALADLPQRIGRPQALREIDRLLGCQDHLLFHRQSRQAHPVQFPHLIHSHHIVFLKLLNISLLKGYFKSFCD